MNTRKILAFSLGPMGASALGLITLPIVAWLFSPADIGRVAMLQVAVNFTLLLFTLGLDQAYVREFHEAEDKHSLLKAVFVPGFVILIISLVALGFSPWSISILLFGIDSSFLTILLVAIILLSFASRFLGLILRMHERGLAFSMSELMPKFIFLVILISYLWFGVETVFQNLLIANFLSVFAAFIIFTWNTRSDWLPAYTTTVDKAKLAQMVRYAIPLIGSGVAFWGLIAMDRFFLRSLSSFQELGIYSVAVSFAGVALVFQAIFSTIWMPLVYKWSAEGVDSDRVKDATDYVTFAVVGIWSLAGMFSCLVTYILPEEYYNVQYILLAVIAYPLLYTLSECTGVGIGIRRKTIYSLWAACLALMVNVLGNWFLIPKYGAAGAAIASSIAFFIFFVIRTEASSKLWVSFKRSHMYSFILLLTAFSVIFNLVEKNNIFIVFFSYLGVVVLSCFVFKRQLVGVYKFCFERV